MDTVEKTVTHITVVGMEDLSLKSPQRDHGLNPQTQDTQDRGRMEGVVCFIF